MTLSRRTILILLIAGGLLIRVLRLTWQPLWWDEGYSIYFATEPFGRMLWLTAHDIHPPLYYALLHGWLVIFQSAQPVVPRLFSLGIGLLALPLLAWLAYIFFPTQPRLALLAVALLGLSPLHLFYSQEIRMYGLAMLLSIASTGFFWQLITKTEQKSRQRGPWIGYVITASLALYTLYYLGLLLLAHCLWAGWHFRRRVKRLTPLLTADGAIAILYLPWVLYAGPTLVQYVGAKVRSDNDTPLTLFNYLARHLVAFTTGHIPPLTPLLWLLSLAGIAAILLLFITTRIIRRLPAASDTTLPSMVSPQQGALWTFLLVPLAFAFLLNLRFPFFPEGGERLLLFVLPYFLLLVAVMLDHCWQIRRIGQLALVGFLCSGAIGIWTFYTTPRYAEHDYRPLIRQVVQQGTDDDTVLAIFPWEIGYWRAYAPADGLHLTHGPHPQLIAEGALGWGATAQTVIDQALTQGTLWFPEPLSFGSTLPGQIETYVAQRATNLNNHWYSTTTRLTAWHTLPTPGLQAHTDNFGPVSLIGAGVTPGQVASANQPLALKLAWQLADPAQTYGVTIRLEDRQGRTWAARDYAPLGSLGSITGATQPIDNVGFITPVGLPPASYQLVVGVVDSHKQLLQLASLNPTANATLALVATITVTQPLQPIPAFRAPVQTPLSQPLSVDGLVLLGYAGYTQGEELLSGTPLDLAFFLQNRASAPLNRQLYVSLLDKNGAGLAGWQGWGLPDYPTSVWPAHALVQTPVTFDLPATAPTGNYRLVAGFVNPATGEKSAAATLDQVRVHQRQANFTKPSIEHPLDAPVQLGTHVRLLGYAQTYKGQQLELELYWQVLQTLLPAHHIFVHLDSANAHTLVQDDGPPLTLAGPAPTGSWLPGEYLTTLHHLQLPTSLPADVRLHVGLYLPASGERLPANINGAGAGDAVPLPLSP